MGDSPNMSDTNLLLTVEDLINISMGPDRENRINFKVLQTVLHILARQLRMLEHKVDLRQEKTKKRSAKKSKSGKKDGDKSESDVTKDSSAKLGKGKRRPASIGRTASKYKYKKSSGRHSDSDVHRKRDHSLSSDEDHSRKDDSDKTGKRGHRGDKEGRKGRGHGEDDDGAGRKGHGKHTDEAGGVGKRGASHGKFDEHRKGEKHKRDGSSRRERDERDDDHGGTGGRKKKQGKRGGGTRDDEDSDRDRVYGGRGRRGAGGSDISITEVERGKDKVLVVEQGPDRRTSSESSRTFRPYRVGSVEVVSRSQFDLLKQAVRGLQNLTGPIPAPTLPDNQQLRDDIARGNATLTDAMQAMQVTARVDAAEQAIQRMAGMLTTLAGSGTLPPDLVQKIQQAQQNLLSGLAGAAGRGGGAGAGRGGVGLGGIGAGGVGPGGVGAGGMGTGGVGVGGMGAGGIGAGGMGAGGVGLGGVGAGGMGAGGIGAGGIGAGGVGAAGIGAGGVGAGGIGAGGVGAGGIGAGGVGAGGIGAGGVGAGGMGVKGFDGTGAGSAGAGGFGPGGGEVGRFGAEGTGADGFGSALGTGLGAGGAGVGGYGPGGVGGLSVGGVGPGGVGAGGFGPAGVNTGGYGPGGAGTGGIGAIGVGAGGFGLGGAGADGAGAGGAGVGGIGPGGVGTFSPGVAGGFGPGGVGASGFGSGTPGAGGFGTDGTGGAGAGSFGIGGPGAGGFGFGGGIGAGGYGPGYAEEGLGTHGGYGTSGYGHAGYSPGTLVGKECISEQEMNVAMGRMREELMKLMSNMLMKATNTAELAMQHAQTLSEQIQEAKSTNSRLSELSALINDYHEQLFGFNEGFSTQVSSFGEQMNQLNTDLKAGLEQLEKANSNAETAAVTELTERYEALLQELDGAVNTNNTLHMYQKSLEDELRRLIEAMELLREQKSDRDEMLDGLRDKADISRLAGLLTEVEFSTARNDIQDRISLCHNKFEKQDVSWQRALSELYNENESKVELLQLVSTRAEMESRLQDINLRLQQLAAVVGEPETAIMTRKLAKDGNCATCMVPALMAPIEKSYGEPVALPAIRPEAIGADGDDCRRPDWLPRPNDTRDHICMRWCGGSHTLITKDVKQQHADLEISPTPRRTYAGYGTDGKLYMLDEDLIPCKECNVVLEPAVKQSENISTT